MTHRNRALVNALNQFGIAQHSTEWAAGMATLGQMMAADVHCQEGFFNLSSNPFSTHTPWLELRWCES